MIDFTTNDKTIILKHPKGDSSFTFQLKDDFTLAKVMLEFIKVNETTSQGLGSP